MAAAASSSSNYTVDGNSPHTSSSYYHVFLSFSGKDTRYGFTDHLHTALEAAGFHTFRDKEDLNRMVPIEPGLEKGIQNSRCSVIVFSKNYICSEWCLDELVMIMERMNTSDHAVLPVFYNVDPSVVSDQTGKAAAKAFASFEERFKADISKVYRWRDTLKKAANLSGLNLKEEADRHEATFVQKIVKEVHKRLRHITLNVTPYLVGVDPQLEEINSWLNDGSKDVGILLICGIPGIGKTTIAKSVYNSNLISFDGGAFLDNINEITSGRANGLVDLQRELLSQLAGGNREMIIHSVEQGINRIKEVVGSKRLILVLDDVGQRNQLDAIIGEVRDWFYGGSKIIITTFKEASELLNARGVSKVHFIKPLGKDESLELFSWHAFGQNRPIDNYKNLSREIVYYCEGHPLALRVLGSSLTWQRSIDSWERTIAHLKSIPNGEIYEKLIISYDTLGDHHVQNLFLDIVCFFIGKYIDFVVTILDGCDYHTETGIQNLQDRCLITIDDKNCVWMHNLVRDMGREIIRRKSPEPGQRSRLWNDNDSYNVLTENTGKQTMEGIVLDARKIPSINSLGWPVILKTYAFTKMRSLRLLILSEVELKGNYGSFPKRLRWLHWFRFPSKHIPNDCLLDSLVVLQMRESNLTQVWKVPKFLPQLKILDLSGSQYLTETPNFLLIPKLERLILSHCASLVYVHESIVNLEKLIYLDMRDCKNIMNLPNICSLKFLETLNISGCSNLNFCLAGIRKLKYLKVFYADNTPMNLWIKSLASSINHLPHRLVDLSLINCNLSDKDFHPLGFGDLSLLRSLDLSNNQISRLPDFVRNLSNLKRLCLLGCLKLKSVKRLPDIQGVVLMFCSSLEKVTFQSADSVQNKIMNLFVTNLIEFEYWFKVFSIESIDTEMINILGLENYLESVRDITINIVSRFWVNFESIPQGFIEHGIINIFLPENKIPNSGMYEYKSRRSPISFTLSSIHKFEGLNIAIVYAVKTKFPRRRQFFDYLTIQIHNISKGLKWIYYPVFFGYQDDGKDMLWLSHWKFGKNQLESGDEVSISIFVHSVDNTKINFNEFGVHVVHKKIDDDDEKMSTQDNNNDSTTDPLNRGGGIGIVYEKWRDYYEVIPGTYFLNDTPLQNWYRDETWFTWQRSNQQRIEPNKQELSLYNVMKRDQIADLKRQIQVLIRHLAVLEPLQEHRRIINPRVYHDDEDVSSDQECSSDSPGLHDDEEKYSPSDEDQYVIDGEDEKRGHEDDLYLDSDDGEDWPSREDEFNVDRLEIKDDGAVGDDLFRHKENTEYHIGAYLTNMHISQDAPLDDGVPPPGGITEISIPKSPISYFENIHKASSTLSQDAMGIDGNCPVVATTTTSCSVVLDLSESSHPPQFSGPTSMVSDPILSDGPVPLFNTSEGTKLWSLTLPCGKFDQVYGFNVLKEDVGLYRAIVERTRQHIATREVIKTDSMLITAVGNVLDIVRGMAKVNARTVASAQLEVWASRLEDAEALHFNVGWIRERFDALVYNCKLQLNVGATISAYEAEIRDSEVLVTELKAEIERMEGELTSTKSHLQLKEFALTRSREALATARGKKEQVEALLSEPSLGTSWENVLSDVI